MRAGKAYISSLGTTGLLIASSVVLLLVVGAFVAFDSWPTQAAAVPEEVAIADAPRPDVVRTHVTERGAPQPQRRAIHASSRRAKSRAADSGGPDRRVLAALPAPEVGPRHLSDAQPAANAAPPRDTRPAHPASVPPPPPLPLVGQPPVDLPAAEVPTSVTLDDVVGHVDSTTPAVGR